VGAHFHVAIDSSDRAVVAALGALTERPVVRRLLEINCAVEQIPERHNCAALLRERRPRSPEGPRSLDRRRS
jgi:hypothetical protein